MLKGERLILRAIERDDLTRLAALAAADIHIEVMAGGDWKPTSLRQWEKRYDQWMTDTSSIQFAIEIDQTFVGLADLHNIKRIDGTAELGILIYAGAYLGKGYGREAVRLLCDYAFRIQNFRRVWLWTFSNNERALRSYLSCGFVEEGRMREHAFVDGQYVDGVMMGLLRSEWQIWQKAAHADKG